jgi:hypothetical protein
MFCWIVLVVLREKKRASSIWSGASARQSRLVRALPGVNGSIPANSKF